MKKKTWQTRIITIVMMAACGAIGYFSAVYGIQTAKSLPGPVGLAMIIGFIPAFFLVIALHEAGHALAGVAVGFDFRLYVVGPFLWEKEAGVWKFKWNTNVNTSGGLVICMPVGEEHLKSRFAAYAAGGPVASALVAVLFYVIHRLVLLIPDPSMMALAATQLCFIVSLLSLIIFLVTLVPLHTGGFSTDGARILRLLRGGAAARFEILVIKIVSGTTGGIRPALIDGDELTEGIALAQQLSSPFEVYLHGMRHYRAFDRGEWDRAEQDLSEYVSRAEDIPAGLRNSVWLDAAFFYAYAREDRQQAEAYWQQFKPSALIPKAQIEATVAAIQLLAGNPATAQEALANARAALPNMMDRGNAIALAEKLNHLEQRVLTHAIALA